MVTLAVRDLCFAYGNHPVLNAVSFDLEEGKLLGLLGPNGAGKSTLFRCILGLERGYTGSIQVNGKEVKPQPPEILARAAAYAPQTHSPSFNYSALDMVLMGTTSQGKAWSAPGLRERRAAEEALDRLGIADLRFRGFALLSGGEQQLVLIARTLVQEAKLLVMDEPTANLDYGNQLRVLSHIKNLSRQGYSVMVSTHNPDHAFWFTDQVLALHTARIAAAGPPEEVLTAGLIAILYGIQVHIRRDEEGILSCAPRLRD